MLYVHQTAARVMIAVTRGSHGKHENVQTQCLTRGHLAPFPWTTHPDNTYGLCVSTALIAMLVFHCTLDGLADADLFAG